MYSWSNGASFRKYQEQGAAPKTTVRTTPSVPTLPSLPLPPTGNAIQEIEFSDLEHLQDILTEDGVVIVNGVLSATEIATGVDLFWQALGEMNPLIKRDAPASWRNQNWPRSLSTGMIQEGGMSGSKFMWYARTRPNVVKLYETLYESSDLIVSLDTCRVVRGQNTSHTVPLHVDQHIRGAFNHINGFQSGIQFTDSGPYDAGFSCVVGSHHHHENLFKYPLISEQKGNHIVIPKDHSIRGAVTPDLKAGSVVLWNMRLVHGVSTGPEKTSAPRSNTITLTAFASYFPRRMQIHKDLPFRLNAAKSGSPNTHWAIAGTGGTTLRLPRARGSCQMTRIASFFLANQEKLKKWI